MKTVHILACSMALASLLGAQAGGSSSLEGQVLSSANDAPVRRAVVTLQRAATVGVVLPGQPPRSQTSQFQAETDDQGHFAFHGVDAGGYRITVQRQGFVAQNGMYSGVQLWLGEGQQLTGYLVRATPQSVITGKVLDDAGDPVMGAQVLVQRAGTANGARFNGSVGNAQSNDLGEYRVAGLSAGDYIVAASYQDRSRVVFAGNQPPSSGQQMVYATTYHSSASAAGEAATVHVTDGAVTSGVDIKLAKVAAFSVHVTVVDSGAPSTQNGQIAYPNLRLRDPSAMPGGGYLGPQRQQDGTFLFAGVPPGSYELTAQRNANGTPGPVASGSMPVEVRDRNLEGVVLQVRPSAELQGVVRFEQPGQCDAANMSVSLRPPGVPNGMYGPIPQPATVGGDLRFTLKNVPAGVYSVNLQGNVGRCYAKSVRYGGQTTAAGALTVTESGPIDITLAAYAAQLSVTAVDRDGNPEPRARVSVVPKDNGMGMNGMMVGPNGMTSQTGQTTFASLQPGTYDLYAFESADPNAPMMFPAQASDALKAFASRAKTVTIPDTGRVSVEVTAIPASETASFAPAPQPAPPVGAKGSLAGKVVNAVNGSPLAGVAVTLGGQFNTVNPPQAPSVETDAQGRFSFPDLAPGGYNLTASAGQRFINQGPGAQAGFVDQVVVGEGQQVSAHVLKLVPGGVIAGTLKDEFGEPVLGARIQAFRYRNEQGGERRLMSVGGSQTDDLGNYRVASLAPGDYYVAVEPRSAPSRIAVLRSNEFVSEPGAQALTGAPTSEDSITGPLPAGPESDYVMMWYPHATQPSAATPVRVAVGATAGNIDMTWRKSGVVRIRGKVVDPSGGAAGEPVLNLIPKGAQITLPGVGSVRAASDGSFEISRVPPGSYTLIARSNPMGGGRGGQLVGSIVTSGPNGSSTRMAVQSIEVKDSSIDGIKMELSAGRTIKGTIRMDGGGSVPQPGFFSLRSEPAVPTGMINRSGDGTVTVNNVFPVVYTLNPQNLCANCYVKSLRYAGKEVPATGFEFVGDGQLEIVLGNTAAVLEGSVTGADGKPAGVAGLLVAPVSGSSPVRTGNADAQGNFYFANLPPGDYRVLAWDAAVPEAFDPPESPGPFARYAKTVTLHDGATEKVQVTAITAAR